MPTTVTKGVTIDASALNAHLRDYSIVLGKNIGEVVRQQAGLFCEDMVKYSRPFSGQSPGSGNTSGAKDTGMDNVKYSIRKIFRPVELATKEQIASLGRYDVFKLWNKRKGESLKGKGAMAKWTAFQARYGKGGSYAFIEPGNLGEMGTIHRGLRTDNGRGPLSSMARRSKQPFAIVSKDRDIERYIRQVQKDVGTLKSAYWFAANRIKAGKVRMPAWVKHPEGEGNAIGIDEIAKPMLPAATVGNTIGAKAGNDRFVKLAISHRGYAMRVAMAAELNKKKIPLWVATAQGMTVSTAKYF